MARGGGSRDGDDPFRPDPERIKKAMQHAAAVISGLSMRQAA